MQSKAETTGRESVRRAIVTYAEGAHEELLDVAMPTYEAFAKRHGYHLIVGPRLTDLPAAWNKVPLLIDTLVAYDEVVWFDCDLVIVDLSEDFPPIREQSFHAMVRHFENNSEVPNSGVWRVRRDVVPLLQQMTQLEVFENHGWYEQAALLTLMGYCVPPQGHHFPNTKCRCVRPTKWYMGCEFMRLCWNSHPNYRADKPRIVHCSYDDMALRLDVMRELVRNPSFEFPKRESSKEDNDDS